MPRALENTHNSWFYLLAFFQALFTHTCFYRSRTQNLKSGCAQYCNATVKVRRIQPGSHPGHQDLWSSKLCYWVLKSAWSQVAWRNLGYFPEWESKGRLGNVVGPLPPWIIPWVPLPLNIESMPLTPTCEPPFELMTWILPSFLHHNMHIWYPLQDAHPDAQGLTHLSSAPLPNPSCHYPTGLQTPPLSATTPFQYLSSWHFPCPGMFFYFLFICSWNQTQGFANARQALHPWMILQLHYFSILFPMLTLPYSHTHSMSISLNLPHSHVLMRDIQ